jgi:hypothetical protein
MRNDSLFGIVVDQGEKGKVSILMNQISTQGSQHGVLNVGNRISIPTFDLHNVRCRCVGLCVYVIHNIRDDK